LLILFAILFIVFVFGGEASKSRPHQDSSQCTIALILVRSYIFRF